jgi:hypothetical protein
VSVDVPPEYRAGLLAEPARYPALVRFSSGQSWEQADWFPDVRGMAVRVREVGGEPLPGALPGVQDFLAINGNVRFARDAKEFARLMPLMQSMAIVPLHIGRSLGFRQSVRLGIDFAGIASRVLTCLSSQTFFLVAPIAVDARAAKFSFRPRVPRRRRAHPFRYHGLRESIDRWLESDDLVWDMMLQPYENETTTPLDDLGVRWTSSAFPVASVALVRRDPAMAETMRAEVETMAFSPWNAITAHRPIGRIQALRRTTYAASATARAPGATER